MAIKQKTAHKKIRHRAVRLRALALMDSSLLLNLQHFQIKISKTRPDFRGGVPSIVEPVRQLNRDFSWVHVVRAAESVAVVEQVVVVRQIEPGQANGKSF